MVKKTSEAKLRDLLHNETIQYHLSCLRTHAPHVHFFTLMSPK